MSLSVNTFDHTGKSTSKTALPKEVFQTPTSQELLAQAVRVYTDRQHQNTNVAKSRGQVSLTTAKVWRQKGTGRARHGSRRAPIFVGGGQAHGPVAVKKTPLTLSKKMRKKAIVGALTIKASQNDISIITAAEKMPAKTKDMQNWLAKTQHKSGLIILDKPHQSLINATKNINSITTTQASRLNIVEILNAKHIYITKPSLKILTSLLGSL